MLPWAVGPLSNRAPQYQNQYTLVNRDGKLRFSALSRRALALPPEVLAEIFFFCLPFDEDLLVVPDPDDAPLVLCAVCRQWRNVALATPKLWSSLFFDFTVWEPPDWDSEPLYVDMCRTWLSRAGNVPLSLRTDNRLPDDATNPLLETIIALSQQWQSVKFGWGVLPLPENGNYPFLEKLNIFSPPPNHPTLSFRDAPRLRDVLIPSYTPRIQLPWHQLTRFGTHSMDIKPCLELLRHASNLVEAHLSILPYGSSALPNTVFPLPQLQFLNLSGASIAGGAIAMPMTLLNCFKFPALKTLGLGFEFPRWDNLTDISPFLLFASQSAFQLHTLVLSVIPTSTDALIECLKATPSVIHLKLQISPRISDVNQVFTEFTDHRDFMPKLESLVIGLLTPRPALDPLVAVNMLIWRCVTSPVTRLQSFRFEVRHRPDFEDSIKSCIKTHLMYPKLEASGSDLGLDARRYEWSFLGFLP
jgi:hypothetical protein